ncbi:Transient receptor putative cation channel subfamily M member 2, partial [Cichlidogyrus casuarinus]
MLSYTGDYPSLSGSQSSLPEIRFAESWNDAFVTDLDEEDKIMGKDCDTPIPNHRREDVDNMNKNPFFDNRLKQAGQELVKLSGALGLKKSKVEQSPVPSNKSRLSIFYEPGLTFCRGMQLDETQTKMIQLDRPARELLIWSILVGKLRMADLFWTMEKEPIAGALLASILLSALGNKTDDFTDKEDYRTYG